jgi:hypothetical protein
MKRLIFTALACIAAVSTVETANAHLNGTLHLHTYQQSSPGQTAMISTRHEFDGHQQIKPLSAVEGFAFNQSQFRNNVFNGGRRIIVTPPISTNGLPPRTSNEFEVPRASGAAPRLPYNPALNNGGRNDVGRNNNSF